VPIYRHPEQRRAHLLRHGPFHVLAHLRSTKHGHQRVVVDPEARIRNLYIYGGIAVGLIVLALAVMSFVSYLSIRRAEHDLSGARSIISNDLADKAMLTTASGRVQLTDDIASVQKDAAEATSSLTGSVSLSLLGHLPVIDTQRSGVISLSNDIETAATDASALLGVLNNLLASSHGTTVSLPALNSLEVYIKEGHKQLAALNRPANGLLGPLASARRSFDQEDAKLVRLLSLSSRTINFALPFLGSQGPQVYLIAGQNNAEMRDGGAVLSLDTLTAADGTFSIASDASYANYFLNTPAAVALPAGTQSLFGSNLPTLNWPATDETADWATSGHIMQAMWRQVTGQTVNGVIGMDVPGVARILALTGPVNVPGESVPISAANIDNQLLNQAYQGLTVADPQNERRDMLAAVVKAAINKMKTEHVDLDAFANALAADVQGRHLMVWSDVPSAESGLVALDAAGTLNSARANRTIHVALENNSADKLDYFVAVTDTMKVTVDRSGNALVNTKVQVANFALAGQPASYQYGPDGINALRPGQYAARVLFWGPKGSVMPGSVSESGLQALQTRFSLQPGQQHAVTFSAFIPHAVVDGRLQLRLVPQARLIPDRLRVVLSAPGWSVTGPSSISEPWSHTLNLSWGLGST
jgi:hypothetical protein